MKVSQYFTMLLLKAQLFFHIVSIFVDSFLPPLDKGMYSLSGKVSTPPAHQLAHSILQCLIIGVMVTLQNIFLRARQVII
jgi:hypothetical protein